MYYARMRSSDGFDYLTYNNEGGMFFWRGGPGQIWIERTYYDIVKAVHNSLPRRGVVEICVLNGDVVHAIQR